MRILQRLLQRGLIDQGQLERLLEAAGASELRLDRLVVELGYVSESQMLEVLGAEQGTPMVDLSAVAVDRAVLARVPEKLIHRTRIMPLYQESEGSYGYSLHRFTPLWSSTPDATPCDSSLDSCL